MKVFAQVNRRQTAWMVLAALGWLVGCSGSDGGKVPLLGIVKGTIKLDGKPLADAMVDFTPLNVRGSGGRTNSDGVYTLDYDESKKGAAVGEHSVQVRTRVEAGTPEKLPAKYNSQSELKATVKAGDNTIDFDLKSE